MNAWRAIASAAAREQARLAAALADAGAQQARFLHDLLAANRDSRFGREHDFARIACVADFQRAVPLRRDVEYAAWFEATARGEPHVLTSGEVIAFESTGGTSGAKLIPYTAASLDAFRAGVLPWLGWLLEARPRIARGVAYVAASPVLRAPATLPCGLPLGLASEAAYLGAELAPALARVLTRPPDVHDLRRWRVATLAHLVRCRDLTLISVWSPTFLLELLDALPREADLVLAQLHAAAETRAARRLERALRERGGLVTHLWPALQAVSMWMDGASAPYAARVAAWLPGVHFDAKGVLATESVITVRGAAGCVPAVTSAFLEFLDDSGGARLTHELEHGARYRVALTTPGGLYRYDIGDAFECTRNGATPTLRFLGRAGLVSDLVGEKLSDSFVADALAALVASLGTGAALVPRAAPEPHYELWVDAAEPLPAEIAASVEARLLANPQYAYARRIGQLRTLAVVRAPGFAQFRARALAARGNRFGDAKSCALILDHSLLPAHARS